MGSDELIERTRESIRERKFTTLLTKPQPGAYLLFSFDLINSTQFKASHPRDWPIAVTRFYELISAELTTRISSAIVWKFIGDEVLFFKQITRHKDLQIALPAAHDALLATTEVLHKNVPSSRELLAVKGTVWIAEAEPIQPSDANRITPPSRNIIVETGRSPDEMRRDFLGPDIDAGFRISKFALRRRLVVSANLACLLYRQRKFRAKIERHLKVVSLQILKGVWHDRHYPIIWYERDWKNIGKTFFFDEHLTHEIAAIIRRGLPKDSGLEIIEKAFSDLGRTEEIDALEAAVNRACEEPQQGSVEIEIPKDRYAEIHCVAVCFSRAGNILAAKRPSTKRRFPNHFEFGCGQLRLGESFSDCLKRAYMDDFGVDLTLDDPPVPINTYQIYDDEEHRVIPGIIFIAYIANPNAVSRNHSKQKHSEIMWISPTEFRPGRFKYVPDFESTMKLAIEARQRTQVVKG